MAEPKWCEECGETLPLSEFYKNTGSKGGRRSPCKRCMRIKARADYAANKESKRAHRKIYRDAHKEKIRAQKRRHYRKHKEKIQAWHARHYQAHKAERKANTRRSRKRNKQWRDEYLRTRACGLCGSRHGLVFHHTGRKNYKVSRMVSDGYSLAVIKAEIALCVLLCRACHARLHAKKRKERR